MRRLRGKNVRLECGLQMAVLALVFSVTWG
jgi:hypothetical protein